jgi:hypothetical protein
MAAQLPPNHAAMFDAGPRTLKFAHFPVADVKVSNLYDLGKLYKERIIALQLRNSTYLAIGYVVV